MSVSTFWSPSVNQAVCHSVVAHRSVPQRFHIFSLMKTSNVVENHRFSGTHVGLKFPSPSVLLIISSILPIFTCRSLNFAYLYMFSPPPKNLPHFYAPPPLGGEEREKWRVGGASCESMSCTSTATNEQLTHSFHLAYTRQQM